MACMACAAALDLAPNVLVCIGSSFTYDTGIYTQVKSRSHMQTVIMCVILDESKNVTN